MRGKNATDANRDQLVEHLMTALVLTLAHDLATESRRKGVSGRDYIGDAVELIRLSRPHIVELLGGGRRRRPREAAAQAHAGASMEPGR